MAAGSVVIDFLARTGSFETDTKRAEQSMRRFQKASNDSKFGLAQLSTGISKVTGLLAGLGIGLSVAGLVGVVNRTREAIDSQAKLAQQLRTSVESIANLQRAGDLAGVSIQQITTASRQLDIAFGRAEQGSKKQVEAFERLGLSARDLSVIPLDQRIAQINKALAENVSATERASIAADLFGARGAALIQQLNPAQIAEAARQVQIFGLNLSDVDAAKVEQANDALSTFSLLGKGIATRITVELAPALQALGDAFLNAAAESGGLATAFQGSVRSMIVAIEPFVNAASFLGRAWDAVFETIDFHIANTIGNFSKLTTVALAGIGAVTGIDVSDQLEYFVGVTERAEKAAKRASDAVDALNRPLLGTELVEGYDRAVKAAEQAAAAGVKARQALNDPATGQSIAAQREQESAQKALQKARESAIKALEREQEILGLTPEQIRIYDLALLGLSERELAFAESVIKATQAVEDQKKLVEEGENLKVSLQTPEEKFQAQTQKITVLYEAGAIDQTTFDRANQAAEEALQESLDQQEQARQAARDQLYEGLLSEEEQISQSYERRKEAILEATEITEQERQDLLNRLAEKRIKDEQTLESDRASALLSANAQLFDGLAGLAKSFAGEQSAAYRILFGISKAFAIADATLKLGQAIANAAASGPPPLNFANMAAVAAAVSAVIAQIASVAFSGARAEGGDVEKGRKYLVGERGPEMFVPKQDGFIVPNRAIKDLGQSAIRGVGVEELFERSIGFGAKRENGGPVTASRSYLVGERGRELYIGRSNDRSSNDVGIYSFPFAGSRAVGGTALAQQRYLIGERGPEMFVPSTDGAIVPNSIFNESPAPVINLRNINAFDASVVDDYLTSGAGEQVLLNVINRNSEATAQFARSGE